MREFSRELFAKTCLRHSSLVGGYLWLGRGLSAAGQRNCPGMRGMGASDVQPRPIRKAAPAVLSVAARLPLLMNGALPQRRWSYENSCEHDFHMIIFSG